MFKTKYRITSSMYKYVEYYVEYKAWYMILYKRYKDNTCYSIEEAKHLLNRIKLTKKVVVFND